MADIIVNSGDNLQTAINNAVAGDNLILEAGAEFVGSFSLPVKAGGAYITLKSSQLANLPVNVRVSPANVGNMATIRTNVNNGPAFYTDGAAHHYRFQGLEIETTLANASDGGIVRLGSNPAETSLSQITHDFDFDRCYVHGQAAQNVQQGFLINAQDATVQNCYVSDIHYIGQDSQAILSYNSPGGLHFINNYLEGAGENIMIGGADPQITNLVPGMTGGIEIKRNYFFKPLSWKVGDPSYAGFHWTIKNLLELKNAKNVEIDGNVFENCWGDAQIGYAVLFTVRNQDGTAPWSIIENVVFTNNTIINSEQGFQLLGKDNLQTSQQGSDLTIANNLIQEVANWGMVNGSFFDVTLNHNTHFQGGNIYTLSGDPATGFVAMNNITVRDPDGFGIKGDGTEEGTATLNVFTPSFTFTKNVIVGANSNLYPSGNFYPADVSTVQFVDYQDGDADGNYRLQPTSPYHNAATDGTDIGVNMDELLAAQSNAGTPSVIIQGQVSFTGKVVIT